MLSIPVIFNLVMSIAYNVSWLGAMVSTLMTGVQKLVAKEKRGSH